MTKLIVFWSIACAFALYQLIRFIVDSKKLRILLANLIFIPFLFYSQLSISYPPDRMGPGPSYKATYEKQQDGYYLFSDQNIALTDDTNFSDEAKENKRVIIQIYARPEQPKTEIRIDEKQYRLLNNIHEIYPDYTMYYNIVWYGSLTALAVFDGLTIIKIIIDCFRKGDESSDENEEKEES